jgi:hypothetical protein
MSACPSVINPFIQGPAPYRIRQYHERAERLRAMAKDFVAREWQDILLRLADSYEELASTTAEEESCSA